MVIHESSRTYLSVFIERKTADMANKIEGTVKSKWKLRAELHHHVQSAVTRSFGIENNFCENIDASAVNKRLDRQVACDVVNHALIDKPFANQKANSKH